MFVGREAELQTLENLYKKNSFQMVVMYGGGIIPRQSHRKK